MKSIITASETALKMLEHPTPPIANAMLAADRRTFLKLAGISVALLVAGCSDNSTSTPTVQAIDLGSGDTGILNYAYALEQLEAAFYIKVTSNFFANATAAEKQILTDIREHEIVHREFFKAALGASAISSLEVNFDQINFSDRTSVLTAAKTFEDLGVAAYNGAGKYLTSADNLLIAGKIVSVEARHAAAIRDLLEPKTAAFAGDDIINASGLDQAFEPTAVLETAKSYIKTPISSSNLPKD